MANRNRVTIVINADGTAAIESFGRVEEKTRGLTGKIKEHWLGVSAAILGVYMAAKKLNDLGGSFIQAGDSAEQYRVRLTTLLGSVEEGNRLFDAMAGYASKVPYEYEQIMGAATSLSGVMKGGVDEVKRWMPLIGDLAAAYGLTIEETTSQVIRMYSSGAASADMFRERGVLAMMGFQAGVSYSVEETQEKIFEAWEKADSKFRGATDSLAGTWSGLMSMFSDLWFKFRNMVMDAGAFDRLKEYFRGLKERIDEAFRTGEAEVWAKRVSELMVSAMEAFELMAKAARFVADNINAIAVALSVAAIVQAPALIMSIVAAVKALNLALAANPAMWVAVVGAVAAFVGYKLGEYLWGINKEMDRLKEIMADVRGEQEYLNERAKKYSGLLKELGYSTVQELTRAIKEGEVIWDKSLKKWINPERERKRAEEAAAARLEVEKQTRDMMEYSDEIYKARELDKEKQTRDMMEYADYIYAAREIQQRKEALKKLEELEDAHLESWKGKYEEMWSFLMETNNLMGGEEGKWMGLMGAGLKGMMDVAGGADPYTQQLEKLRDFYQQKLTLMSEAGATEAELRQEFQNYELEQTALLQQQKLSMYANTANMIFGVLGTLGSFFKNNSKAMFYIQKAHALVAAAINTAQGVSAAIALGPAGLPFVPVIKTIGALQMAAIAASTLMGPPKTAAGGVSSGGGYQYEQPEAPRWEREAEKQPTQVFNYHIYTSAVIGDLTEAGRVLAPHIRQAEADGV